MRCCQRIDWAKLEPLKQLKLWELTIYKTRLVRQGIHLSLWYTSPFFSKEKDNVLRTRGPRLYWETILPTHFQFTFSSSTPANWKVGSRWTWVIPASDSFFRWSTPDEPFNQCILPLDNTLKYNLSLHLFKSHMCNRMSMLMCNPYPLFWIRKKKFLSTKLIINLLLFRLKSIVWQRSRKAYGKRPRPLFQKHKVFLIVTISLLSSFQGNHHKFFTGTITTISPQRLLSNIRSKNNLCSSVRMIFVMA